MNGSRPKTYAFCGGAFGDEGKGRIVDLVVHRLCQQGDVVVYRDNGGANAGHTVEFENGKRVALHQLPSGIFIDTATVVLGKEMVLHPGDLLEELRQVKLVKEVKKRAKILIDEMALLSLNTHRAYEGVLKQWQEGGKASTGRGISPAYADVLLRHPLRMRDIITFNTDKIKLHYDMYAALIDGLGSSLGECEVITLAGEKVKVGTRVQFVNQLKAQAQELKPYVKDIHEWLIEKWADKKCGFVFEKAQGLGLDYRWGVYPDITASDTTFDGIFSATAGVIDPDLIQVKAGVIKATYMSSVGSRKLPTLITGKLAEKIREDAHEYGATTKRPRDIAYLDIPALRYFARVGRLTSLVLTHMDICYAGQAIKVCTEYRVGKKKSDYRPDQEFLNTVKPVYVELPSWDTAKLHAATKETELPKEAKSFLKFISKEIGLPIMMITTGPQREQGIILQPL